MKELNISIVICVADDERIENILNSIDYRCEVVIVLNGATKQVKSIVNDYKKQSSCEVKIIELKDRNLSKARDIGTRKTKYDKVVHYDSDCIIAKGALEKYNKYLTNNLLVDGRVKFKSDTCQSKVISVMRSMGLPGYALCPSIGINKKIIEKIGYYFDEDIKWIEDAEMNNRAKKAGIKVKEIKTLTCIHDNLTFKQDLKSAYRYGSGVRIAAKKGLHKKRPTANWNLIIPCFKKNILSGFYSIIWNFIYCIGYYF